MKGAKLPVIGTVHLTTWGAWRKKHPDTKVLSVNGTESPGRDNYSSYHLNKERSGVRPVQNLDTRLPSKTKVIGLTTGEEATAISESSLRMGTSLEHTIEGKRLLLVRIPPSGLVAAWIIDGYNPPLTFPETFEGDTIQEISTGSQLNLTTGTFTNGPLQGKDLNAQNVARVYWFVWADYHPKTTIYKAKPQKLSPKARDAKQGNGTQ